MSYVVNAIDFVDKLNDLRSLVSEQTDRLNGLSMSPDEQLLTLARLLSKRASELASPALATSESSEAIADCLILLTAVWRVLHLKPADVVLTATQRLATGESALNKVSK